MEIKQGAVLFDVIVLLNVKFEMVVELVHATNVTLGEKYLVALEYYII